MKIFDIIHHKELWEYIATNADEVWRLKEDIITRPSSCYLPALQGIPLADATIQAIKEKYFREKQKGCIPDGHGYACNYCTNLGCIDCPIDIGDCCEDKDSYYNNLSYCLLNDDMCGFVYWCIKIRDAKVKEGVITNEVHD